MNRKQRTGIFLALFAMAVFAGCSKNPASVDVNSNDEAIRQLVEENMDYITSAGVNDDGAQPINYVFDGLGKTTTEISPLKFGRRGKFRLQQISIEYPEPGKAIATIVYSFDGSFFVLAEDTSDSNDVGKLYKKEMSNTITRRAIFRKIANTAHPRRNWKLRRVSGSELRSPDTQLQFTSIVVQSSDGNQWTIENPLDFIQDIEAVPTFSPGDSVKVFVKVENAAPDTVLLRYRNDRGFHRARKAFRDDGQGADEIAGDGIYSGEWVIGHRRGIFHAFADAFDPGTITDDVAPYNALAWGFPYIVKRH